MGARTGELITVAAGTGMGKSTLAGVIAHHWIKSGLRVGYISLEESLGRTAERLVGAELGKALHLSREGVTEEQIRKVWKDTFEGRICIFNHFGSMDAQTLLSRVRFMRQAEGVDFIIIDHLSILVSGWSSGDGDERRLIDNVMTSLRSLCEQTGVGMLLISHLRSTDNRSKGYEEGAVPRMADLRGSQSIGGLSDTVMFIVRDKTSDNPNKCDIYIPKSRHAGRDGRACSLLYDRETATFKEVPSEEGADYGF